MKPRLILLAQCICTISILVVACEPATSTSASEPNPTITLPTTLTSLPNPVTNAISTPGHGSVVQAPPPILTTTPTITLVSDRCLPAEATGIIASGGIVLYDHNNFSLIIKGRSELRIPEQPTLDSYTRKVFLTPSDTYLGYDLVNQDNYDLVIRESNGSIYKDYPEAVLGHSLNALGGIYASNSADWINDDAILVRTNANEFGSMTLFLVNINTGSSEELPLDFPDLASGADVNWGIDDIAIHMGSLKGTNIVYDSSLTRVVYPKIGGIATLYDVNQKKELASLPLTDATDPQWSPDGKLFVIKSKAVSSTGEAGDEFFIVSRDGPDFRQLTYLGNLDPGISIGAYSWSPDSQKIAFWMKTKDASEYSLASLDLNTGAITNYCVNGVASYNSDLSTGSHPGPVVKTGKPVWSPDQTQLLISQFDTAHKHINVILVDLVQGLNFKLTRDVEPVGWLKEP